MVKCVFVVHTSPYPDNPSKGPMYAERSQLVSPPAFALSQSALANHLALCEVPTRPYDLQPGFCVGSLHTVLESAGELYPFVTIIRWSRQAAYLSDSAKEKHGSWAQCL